MTTGPDADAAAGAANQDVFKLMLATDNHLGYLEKDAVRGDDSFNAFEEILRLARDNDVDFLLLGGDLFHDNKPSRKCLNRTISLLRQYCLGDRPCFLHVLSDQARNFHIDPALPPTVNFQDPNLNVALPVFTIHGNHDDPSGDGGLSTLDILSNCGLVNYFGNLKDREADLLTVEPVLLQKGTSRLALYGLGNVRDERLHRMWLQGKVKFMRPESNANDANSDWFNMFIIHQNRAKHGETNYIPESFIDPFMDLVFWGHEHECLIGPQAAAGEHFYITQPGSSVATGLTAGEARQKHVALVQIKGASFELTKVRLKSVRPFKTVDLTLNDQIELNAADEKGVERFLANKVEDLLAEVSDEYRELNELDDSAEVPPPLIRVRVFYSGKFSDSVYHPHSFGHQFVGRVANPFDVLRFSKMPTKATRAGKSATDVALIGEPSVPPEEMDLASANDLIAEFMDAQALKFYPENELGDSIRTFVEKDDKDCVENFVNKTLESVRKALARTTTLSSNDDIVGEVTVIKESMSREYSNQSGKHAVSAPSPAVDAMQEDSDTEVIPKATPARGKTPATSRRTAAAAPVNVSDSDDNDDDMMASPPPPAKTRTARKPAARAAPAKSRAKKAAPPPSSDEDEVELIEDTPSENSDDDEVSNARPPAKRKTTASSSGSSKPATKRQAATTSRQTKISFKPKSAASGASAWPPRRS